MTDREKQLIETISKVFPELPEEKKEWLLGFGEGIAFSKSQQEDRLHRESA